MANSQELQSKKCTICDKTFSRSEHLKRHIAIHKDEKPFGCRYCEKKFSRKDAAHRHEQSHLPKSTASESSDVSIRHTCSSCAQARVRCSGNTPCDFCSARALECVYRPRKRRRRRYSNSDNQDLDNSTAEIPTSAIPSDIGEDATLESFPLSRPRPTDQSPPFDLTADRLRGVDCTLSTSSAITSTNVSTQRYPALNSTGSQASRSHAPRVASVNWLPFRASHIDSMPFSLQAQNVVQDQHETFETPHPMHLIGEETLPTSLSMQQQLVGTPALQSDQVSALIASMLTNSAVFDPESPSTHSARLRVGRLYADGQGARVSQSDRRASLRASTTTSGDPTSPRSNSAWLSILREKVGLRASQGLADSKISCEVHTELIIKISDHIDRSAYSAQNLSHNEDIMAITIWDYLIQLYFDHFHPIYPFLDQSLLGLPTWGWALCLATAAVGARYTALAEVVVYGEFLSKTLHRILITELEAGEVDDALPFLQARVICAINLCQSRQHDHMVTGMEALTFVCNSGLRLRLLHEDRRAGEFQQGQVSEQAWIAWRFRETRRRTGIFIISTVVNMAFIQVNRPNLDLDNVSLLLPSSEDLWQAETCQQWYQRFAGNKEIVSNPNQFRAEESSRKLLQDAVRSLWVENQLHQSMSPFTTEAVIHMMIKRIWYADQYLGDQLYVGLIDQDPQLQSYDADVVAYPGSDPKFAKWRNATCDCLDIIHWDALSISARACGFESTIFLSLHLARLLLLTPVKELLGFVHECAGHPPTWVLPHNLYASSSHRGECGSAVRTWWFQDRYKARLALIHAGAIFWHIRRYASDSYMQPFAVYLATVVLWAYGTCANRYLSQSVTRATEGHLQNFDDSLGSSLEGGMFGQHAIGHTPPVYPEAFSGNNNMHGATRMPGQAQIDRPIDDELVQHFIRHGSLRLCLEGVPDLCLAEGPLQALREGITILQFSTATWPITERYISSLRDLASGIEAM